MRVSASQTGKSHIEMENGCKGYGGAEERRPSCWASCSACMNLILKRRRAGFQKFQGVCCDLWQVVAQDGTGLPLGATPSHPLPKICNGSIQLARSLSGRADPTRPTPVPLQGSRAPTTCEPGPSDRHSISFHPSAESSSRSLLPGVFVPASAIRRFGNLRIDSG